MNPTFARITAALFLWAIALPASASDGARMAQVMAALEQRDFVLAEQLAGRIQGKIGQDIARWHRLRAGDGRWQEYADFLRRNADWPGLPLMRKKAEATLPEGLSADQLRAIFQDGQPQTGRGALLLASELRGDGANAVIERAWARLPLTQEEREAFQARYPAITRAGAAKRLDTMLWAGKPGQAEALLPFVSQDLSRLAAARIKLQRNEDGVDQAIKAVPAKLADDAGLAHDRFAWRMRKDYYDSAEDLLRARSTSAKALGQPEDWANRRRLLARRALREGRPRQAYNLASQHFLSGGSHYADLEWLAGYIALIHVKDPDRALRHFERFRLSVATPISLGRAGYWAGKAHETKGDLNAARAAYGFASAYQTSFYGQLATERARLPMDTRLGGSARLPGWKNKPFAATSPFKAALLLRAADEHQLMQRFLLHVQESLSTEESAALSGLALEIDRPFAALKIAKRTARAGVILPSAYYPVIPLAQSPRKVPPELALAIARQESELNPFAISPVGARGLMQLMPATAKRVSNDLGLEYSLVALTENPGYNSRLGTAYLAEMLDRYGGSVLLAAAAYNAGPTRVDRWIEEYGDPRARGVDTLWWIENIPFRETRNYVMRVLEALHVYRLRLGQKPQEIGLARRVGQR